MGYLQLCILGSNLLRFNFVYSVFINIDCNKRGQTSRLVARAQIQTNCNLQKNMYNCIWVLDLSIECSSSYSLVIKPKIALRKFKMSGRID